MRLVLHGTGAGNPNPDRLASSLSATFSDGSIVLFDAGEGASRAMLRDGVDLQRITTILVSHTHADHWTGLPAFLVAWAQAERTDPVDIHLPAGTIPFFEGMLVQSHSYAEKRDFDLRFHDIAPIELPDGWRLGLFETTHLDKVKELAAKHGTNAVALGYVLSKANRKIVFSQDVGAADDLRDVMKGAELLVCECTHAEPIDVLGLAREGGVERVIFTHVPRDGAEFPERFDGVEWRVAREGEVVEIEE